MRTEEQLRAALRTVAERAPVTEGLIHRLQLEAALPSQQPRPRRAAVVVGAGAALALLATAIVLQVYPRPMPEPADRRTPGNWAMVSELSPPVGWTVESREVSGTFETTGVSDPTGKQGCAAEINGRGVPPHTPVPAGSTSTTVGGRPARYLTTPGQEASVFWAYDDQAWASVACWLGPSGLGPATSPAAVQDLVVRLAERVRFGDFRLLLPIRLDRLPAGYAVTSVIETPTHPERWSLALSPGEVTEATPEIRIDTGEDAPIPAPDTYVGPYPASTATFRIGGPMGQGPREAISYTALYIRSSPVPIRISTTNTGADDPGRRGEALRRIATEAGLGFATSPTDTTTWFDAAEGLPS